MSLITAASSASAQRGYIYYTENRVVSYVQTDATEFDGVVSGGEQMYTVHIDIEHPRKSTCTCPHADGRRIVCKHMIALYFTIFPEEAENYLHAIEEGQRAYERQVEEMDKQLIRYINSLSKQELRDTLYNVLNRADWLYDQFVRENIEW